MNDNELMHYGVLGMKWGVKHNPSKAFVKASKKANKLNDKYSNRSEKANAAWRKSQRIGKNYHTEIGRGRSENAYKKAVRSDRKAKKALKKSERWNRQMLKSFADVSIDSIDAESLAKGKQYVDMLKRN